MSKKKILIHGGIVVNESSMSEQDIVIHDEKIVALCSQGECLSDQFDEVIDATGLYVFPGLIDPHVHFDAPFMGGTTDHDFHTGTKAAAFGGITTVISFSNQAKGESLISNLAYNENKAFGKAYVDWSLHGLIYDASEQTLSELPELVKEGIPTYKCFTTYRHSGRLMDDDGMLKVLKATADGGGMLMIHCENDAIAEYRTKQELSQGHNSWIYHARSRPALAENVAIQRVVDLMKVEPAPVYIVHASTAESVQIIQDAQSQNLPIHCETCTHYLILTEELLNSEMGHLFICSPPLRTEKDMDALWTAARIGPIAVVSSDDAGLPSDLRTRLAEGRFDKVPNGMPGVEPRLTMLYTEGVLKNRISLQRLVQLTATNPARIFGLHPDKGSIAPGADADIVLFDPNIEWTMSAETLHMNTDFCPFAGRSVTGKPKTVLCRGELVIQDFELVGSQAHGRRVFRKLDKTLLG
ncbi:MAG TPA: dihydropyrimidinase [Anaerolineaceae bacterium]|nr:dihydropyrimidinase [Anaerolineaceae bacterium]